VIDLNHILLFIACISPLVMLGQTLRRGGLFRAWRLASLAVLVVTAGAWFVHRETAGFVGGGAWLALLLFPAVGMKRVAELAGAERYSRARRWTAALRFLHPAAALPAQTQLFRALELAQQGDFSGALALLAPLRNNQTNVGRQAIAQSFRLRGEWTNLVAWVRTEVPPPIRRNDFALVPLYLRALGESGARDEMVLEFANLLSAGSRLVLPSASYHSSRLIVLSFTGRLATDEPVPAFRRLPQSLREFWKATNELATGDVAAARVRLEKLQEVTRDRLLLSEIAQRLAGAETFGDRPLAPAAFALVLRIEQIERQPLTAFGSETMRPTIAVFSFIVLNVAMFVAEVRLGGSMDPLTLHRLGALEPWAIRFGGEYWRMATSLFLHYGPLHLLFNLYALFVIGPGLERIIGSVRFAAYYLLAGLGSSAGVLLLRLPDWSRPEQLVGASGCVLGVVGVWAGYLLRHRDEPFAGRRLRNIVLIVAIQIAFDLSTPQISMAAHLSGLATGIVLGLLISPGRRSERWNA
jgi:rhomboid protease GluP